MKYAKCFLRAVCFILLLNNTYAQDYINRDEGLILQFLTYIGNKGWDIDTITNRYVLLRDEESPVATREQRKQYISSAISALSSELNLNNINPNELIIKSYTNCDSDLQIMRLTDSFAQNVYVAYTKNKRYKRYFLIEGSKIKSFVLFNKNKAFLLLN